MTRSTPDVSFNHGQLQQVAAVLAHELRNPLSVFRTAVDLLSSESNSDRRIHEILKRQVDHMTHLVDDLLDMSRNSNGKTRLIKRPVKLQAIIESAMQSLESTLTTHRQSITTTIPDLPLWINADQFRISQILINLLSNASKYSEPGDEIQLTVKSDETMVEIRVIDEGMGIDASDLPILFDFFSQSPHALDHSQGGLGIGLALVQGLVEMHGGTVTAVSQGKGTGSEFIVRLPLCNPEVCAAPQPVPVEPIPACRVLVVDDRRDNEYLLKALVKAVGTHETRSTSDGPATLDLLSEWVPHVILLDIGLPGMSGFELAREIRKLEECGTCLIVALTGYDDDDMRQEARESGIDLYRLKPASIEMIREILSQPQLA